MEDGINLLKSYDIVVHPRCHHLVDELIHYSLAVDRQTGEILPKLADSHNHVIDALRYALEGARRAGSGTFSAESAGRRVMADLPGYDLHSSTGSAGQPMLASSSTLLVSITGLACVGRAVRSA